MKDLGAANCILGMEIKRDREKGKLWLNQRKYLETILQRFNMEDSKPVYVKTREGALDSSEQGFRYFCGTSDYGLCYQGRAGLDRVLDIHGFVDADWAGDLDQRRSTSGYMFNLFGGAVSWMSKKQSVAALSTTEAEYMASHSCKASEAVGFAEIVSTYGVI
eukprot:PITA_29824